MLAGELAGNEVGDETKRENDTSILSNSAKPDAERSMVLFSNSSDVSSAFDSRHEQLDLICIAAVQIERVKECVDAVGQTRVREQDERDETAEAIQRRSEVSWRQSPKWQLVLNVDQRVSHVRIPFSHLTTTLFIDTRPTYTRLLRL